MTSDRIEREVLVQASVERVWAVVTEAEHVARWFAFGGAEVEARPGGALVLRWDEHGTFRGRVVAAEPPRRFAYRWALVPDVEPGPGNSTLVEITLTPEGDATRLRVVESGFDALDVSPEARARHVAENEQGWLGGLDALRDYAAGVAA